MSTPNSIPRIKSFYSIVSHSKDCVELRTGTWSASSHVLRDDQSRGVLFDIIQSLNGTQTEAAIAESLNVALDVVSDIVSNLMDLDVLEYDATNALQHYMSHFKTTIGKYNHELQSKFPIILVGSNNISRDILRILSDEVAFDKVDIKKCDSELLELLNAMDESCFHDGLEYEKLLMRFEAWKGAFVVFTQPIINPALAQYVNKICWDLGVPWMNVAIDGSYLFVGPIFTGKASPCFECFETRMLMNIKLQESYLQYKSAMVKGLVTLPATPLHSIVSSLLASHAAMEIINYCLTESAFTLRKTLSIYLPTMELNYNEVLPLAGCGTCGPIARRDDTQLYFDVQSLL